MMRSSWLALVAAAFFTTACGNSVPEKIRTMPGGGGTDTDRDTFEKASPEISGADFDFALLNELARMHRTAELLREAPRDSKSIGCASLRASPGKETFLVADFARCRWHGPSGRMNPLWAFAIHGQPEKFVSFEGESSPSRRSEASFDVLVSRLGSDAAPVRIAYKRAARLELRAVAGALPFEALVTFGAENQTRIEFWKARLRGFWRMQDGAQTLEAGAILETQFRSRPGKDRKSVTHVTRWNATSEIRFAGDCRRPLGTFTVFHRDKVLKIRTDAGGINDLDSGIKTPWSGPCLESDSP